MGLAIGTKSLFLLGVMEGASLGISDLLMERNSVIVVSWFSQGKRGSWKLGRWTHKIIDLLCSLCCFFTWILGEASQVPDDMANHGALMLEIFFKDSLPHKLVLYMLLRFPSWYFMGPSFVIFSFYLG